MLTEKEVLKRYLQEVREALVWKLDGLSERDVRRPMTRTESRADILRELIDGEAGHRIDNSNMPERDEAWWVDHVATLQHAAEEASP